uniref:Intersectin 2a n=1 Tax=Cyprinus carpio TaxID=7962 RepID=A0A8C1M1M8_CYPCA
MRFEKTEQQQQKKIPFTFSVPLIVAGGFNIWAITPEERGKHDKQFDSLAPTLGFLSGDQARTFFLQSGLPTAVLADIWALADIGKDGKMDRLEFSIAMKLIKLQLQGQPLPSSLPIIMKQTPTPAMTSSSRFGMGSMPNLSAMSVMPVLTPILAAPAMTPLVPVPALMSGLLPQMPNSVSVPALPNGNAALFTPTPGTVTPSILNSFCSGLSKSHSLLDLGSSSSNSSSTTSLASNSPKMNASDWAVPQSSRLKYRQQFNSLDKLMSGYLSGPQVRNALTASNLTQTQLSTIWALADVDRDGQLRAEEFILAMHLVDMAKTGRPLPLTLPPDLLPPSLRGNAELEKRRLALREEARREEERRQQKGMEERERKEREAREMELRRQREEERRIERQKELERQREEERLKELERREASGALERQRRMEWEKSKRVELQTQREKEQIDIQRLKERKRSLEMELEAVVRLPFLLFIFFSFHIPVLFPIQSHTVHAVFCGIDSYSILQIKNISVFSSPRVTSISRSPIGCGMPRELRQRQSQQQDVLEQLRRVRSEKLKELQRHRKEEEERKRKKEEEERKRKKEEEEKKRKKEEEERKRKKEEEAASFFAGLQPVVTTEDTCPHLTSYRALYPFTARNSEELTLEADYESIDESTVRETGWLYGSYRGNSGWFPESYAERCCKDSQTEQTAAVTQSTAPSTNYPGYGTKTTLLLTRLCNIAVALCEWSAKTDSHLGFSKDDIITVLEKQENWCYGELNESRGWFPCSYVLSWFLFDLILLEYVALYTYESPESGDLTFCAEDVVLVTEREGEWWRGCIGDQSGLFPSNYVKPKEPEIAQVSTANAATTPEQLSLTPGQLIVVLHKNSNSWWLGELQARGKKRKKGWFHSSNVRLLEANSGKITPASQPLCQVIAMYDYKAANKDEMSFQKGQLITVFNKDNPDWWKGEVAGVVGLFPTNYVKMTTESDPSQQWCADLLSLESMCTEERKRQGYIHELIQTEETYLEDLELALEVFYKPMAESGRLTEAEMSMIFVNWQELIMCSTKLLKALRVRKKMAGERMPVQVVGDILSSELSHMQAYIRFCSCQLNAAALLQQKTDKSADFKLFLKKIASNYRCKGMPLSSFLLKPMQRITRYPLLIKNILENTHPTHADHANLKAALDQAEELCSQVNEGVREKENSDRLEWIQNHVLCDGVIEHLVFNSLTNCLGPRKLLHSGKLHKTKSNKELWAFLFNDFLLLTNTSKQFSSGPDKLFNPNSNAQYKMYKMPVFLNEVLVKMPSDPSSDDPVFHISHIDRVYTLKADTINERTTWVQKIKAASDHFIETEKLKREKAYQARSQKNSGIGRLLVTVLEATELKPCKPNGKSNPYCELTMGAQCYSSRHQPDTLNPKWNFNCHFFIKDLYQDVLCLTIFERDQFSPDDFLGRTEVPVATVKKDQESKGPLVRRLLLHEVPTGEVKVRLDLQLYDQTPHL